MATKLYLYTLYLSNNSAQLNLLGLNGITVNVSLLRRGILSAELEKIQEIATMERMTLALKMIWNTSKLAAMMERAL